MCHKDYQNKNLVKGESVLNRKKKCWVVLLSFIAILIISYGLISIPRRIVSITPSEVSSIDIFDGHTGKSITITNRNDIEHIIGNLNTITFKKDKWSLGYMGYSLRTTIYKENGGIYKKLIINSIDTLRDDPFFYKDSTKSIDYDFIRNLIDNQS